jgi:TetR/AcrR family transcriptional repressor of nem operon
MNKGEQTRERIIESAMALLNRRGIADTSIADLMKATDLEKGGIYRHFDSKDEIVGAALRRYIVLIEERLRLALDGHADPRERLRAIVTTLGGIAEHPIVPGGCMLMNLAVEVDFAGCGPRDQVLHAFRRWERLFRRELEQGVEVGVFRPDLDISGFTAVAISAIEGAIVLQAIRPGLSPGRCVIQHLTDWLAAATCEAPKSGRGRP